MVLGEIGWRILHDRRNNGKNPEHIKVKMSMIQDAKQGSQVYPVSFSKRFSIVKHVARGLK
jgi:hypothetical protein